MLISTVQKYKILLFLNIKIRIKINNTTNKKGSVIF